MKVCILATSFPRNEHDFVGQWILGLARALVAEGAQVTVIAPHDHDTLDHEVMDGVVVRRFAYWIPRQAQGLCYGAGIPTNIRRRKWLAFQFPALELAFLLATLRYGRDANLINAHWTFAALPAVIASWILRKPLVIHAYSAEYIPKALRPVNRFVVRNSKAVISISRFTRDVVEQAIKPRRHAVIGLGVNSEKIAPPDFDVAAFRRELGLGNGEKLIFAVGRLVERKGYRVLIDAVALLVQKPMPVRLILAGSGPEREALQTQIERLGLERQVRLIGFVPDAELRHFLKAADLLVMPSIIDQTGDTEGLGIPTVEAMANGTPVVASEIGGITDIVRHEQTGLLVPPGDPAALAAAVERILTDDDLRSRLIIEGHELVETEYAWRHVAQQTAAVFEAALRYTPVKVDEP